MRTFKLNVIDIKNQVSFDEGPYSFIYGSKSPLAISEGILKLWGDYDTVPYDTQRKQLLLSHITDSYHRYLMSNLGSVKETLLAIKEESRVTITVNNNVLGQALVLGLQKALEDIS